jgi:putative transposase
VHMNPLRHRLCAHATDWQWSSLHRFVAAGLVGADGQPAAAPAHR